MLAMGMAMLMALSFLWVGGWSGGVVERWNARRLPEKLAVASGLAAAVAEGHVLPLRMSADAEAEEPADGRREIDWE